MNIPHEIDVACNEARKIGGWLEGHFAHLADVAEAVASSPVGHALTDTAGVLLPEDEQMIASLIHALAAIRRHPETAPAAPPVAADGPPPVTEGDDPAPDSDGAPATAQDAQVTA